MFQKMLNNLSIIYEQWPEKTTKLQVDINLIVE